MRLLLCSCGVVGCDGGCRRVLPVLVTLSSWARSSIVCTRRQNLRLRLLQYHLGVLHLLHGWSERDSRPLLPSCTSTPLLPLPLLPYRPKPEAQHPCSLLSLLDCSRPKTCKGRAAPNMFLREERRHQCSAQHVPEFPNVSMHQEMVP